MPSVQMNPGVSAVTTEFIPTGSAGSPHTLMGWVRSNSGGGRPNNPFLGSFVISGSSGEATGNIGYTFGGTVVGTAGREFVTLAVVNWSSGNRQRTQFPDSSMWYYVVLQFGSGSTTNTNMKVFTDSGLTKQFEINAFYAPTINIARYMGINGSSTGQPGQFRDVRMFYSGAFTDAECIAQARSTVPVAHSKAVLWDAWPFDELQFTGSINNKVLRLTGTPTLAPDQPFVFINPTTVVTGSNSSQVQISTTGYAPVIIGAR